jgi:hypothetical protein
MAKISVQNFEQAWPDDVLAKGASALRKGILVEPYQQDNYWMSPVKGLGDEDGVVVELNPKQQIVETGCGCSDFDFDTWATDPCQHVVGLMYFIKENMTQAAPVARDDDDEVLPKKRGRKPKSESDAAPKAASEKKSKEKAVIVKKKYKDPAEQLLSELEPKEIYDFVRTIVTTNKEIKSKFLLHFSHKAGAGTSENYKEIVQNAIGAIKGRRKYIEAADAAKIVTALNPLYKQAAAAESKGYFAEALAIWEGFAVHMVDLYGIVKRESSRLDTLQDNLNELIKQIINNKNTPPGFNEEVLKIVNNVIKNTTNYNGYIRYYFELFSDLAELTKNWDVFDSTMSFHANKLAPLSKQWDYKSIYKYIVLAWVAPYVKPEAKNMERATKVMLQNKKQPEVVFLYVQATLKLNELDAAAEGLNILDNFTQKEKNATDLYDFDSDVAKLYIILYAKRNRFDKMLGKVEVAMRRIDRYTFDNIYPAMMDAVPAKDKPQVLDQIINSLKKTKHSTYAFNPYIEILFIEKRYKELFTALVATKESNLFLKYADILAENVPDKFMEYVVKEITSAVKSYYLYGGTGYYQNICKILRDANTKKPIDGYDAYKEKILKIIEPNEKFKKVISNKL